MRLGSTFQYHKNFYDLLSPPECKRQRSADTGDYGDNPIGGCML
jgi:hypothetical protein